MEKRIKAVRSTFGLMITTFELVIAFGVLVRYIGSNDGPTSLLLNSVQTGYGTSGFVASSGITGPVRFLLIVLAFMLFGFFLFTMVPRMIDKREKIDY